ncbi:c-type cytochrome [Cloacibacterium sp.]|uniref:c-type cytochrome n=1 Tax=Cloacibacterium sp. TaxID=1913682 RepID=UPI0035B2A94E
MKNLKLFLIGLATITIISCGGDKKIESSTESNSAEASSASAESTSTSTSSGDYDPKRGLGKYDESNVDVSKFDATMAAEGKKIAEVKCTSCHKPTEEKLVGPGWKGVTTRQTPYWIMNFISNPDPMISVDPELQKQLEICLVRMPNQGLNETEARQVVEYMREIDGAK